MERRQRLCNDVVGENRAITGDSILPSTASAASIFRIGDRLKFLPQAALDRVIRPEVDTIYLILGIIIADNTFNNRSVLACNKTHSNPSTRQMGRLIVGQCPDRPCRLTSVDDPQTVYSKRAAVLQNFE